MGKLAEAEKGKSWDGKDNEGLIKLSKSKIEIRISKAYLGFDLIHIALKTSDSLFQPWL